MDAINGFPPPSPRRFVPMAVNRIRESTSEREIKISENQPPIGCGQRRLRRRTWFISRPARNKFHCCCYYYYCNIPINHTTPWSILYDRRHFQARVHGNRPSLRVVRAQCGLFALLVPPVYTVYTTEFRLHSFFSLWGKKFLIWFLCKRRRVDFSLKN